MKVVSSVFAVYSCLLGLSALADPQPRGNLLELHSCELYAGGCIVSSQATLEGRYMLQAWNFADGSVGGTKLAGLTVAVLRSAAENLAARDANTAASIVYLPDNASTAQRAALLSWLKTAQPDLQKSSTFQTRVVPLSFRKTSTGYALSAGTFVSVESAPPESCQTGACGESLWYKPRAQTSVFTVAMDRFSSVEEPLLHLKWSASGRRSIFIGTFGQNTPARDVYVSLNEVCGPAGLF
jgi:hypothetical protein